VEERQEELVKEIAALKQQNKDLKEQVEKLETQPAPVVQ
jgi:cell division protein FtsB